MKNCFPLTSVYKTEDNEEKLCDYDKYLYPNTGTLKWVKINC